VDFYVQLLERVRALPEWKEFMAQGAFKPSTMSGPTFVTWLDRADSFHRVLMREAKLTYAASAVSTAAAPTATPAKPGTKP
jgi:putative tricarboxylic transport membrane protein